MEDDGRSPLADVCGKVEAFAAEETFAVEECEDVAASSQSRIQGRLKGNPTMQNPLLIWAPDREVVRSRQYTRWKSREGLP